MRINENWINPFALPRPIAGIAIVLCLSGCLSTMTPTKPSVVKQIQQQEMKDTIDEHIEEFKTIKPAIERLIAMENDFKVMVSQIAKINSPTISPSDMSQSYTPESAYVALDPHNGTPDVEVLYVSDTEPEPEPLFAIETNEPDEIITADAVVTLQSAEPLPKVNAITSARNPALLVNDSIIDEPIQQVGIGTQPSSSQIFNPRRGSQVRLFPASSYPTCAPLGVSSDARKYGIHVASYDTIDSLPRGWSESVQRFPDFCQKGAVIQKVVVKSKEFYSMRVGPYVSRSEAKSICYALKKQKQYCRVTDFTGETL